MRIRLSLRPIQLLVLPVDYRSAVQGLVYRHLQTIDADFSAFLHNQGYQALHTQRASFKLFCFSSLCDHKGEALPFSKPAGGWVCVPHHIYTIYFSSPVAYFIETILHGLFISHLERGWPLQIGRCFFRLESIDFEVVPAFPERVPLVFRCIGGGFVARAPPGVLGGKKSYLTLEHGDLLAEALGKNLRMKMEALFQGKFQPTDPMFVRLLPEPDIPLERQSFGYPFSHGPKRQVVVGTPAKVVLQGPCSWLQMAWLAGLGEKNSQGMGMIDISHQE